MITEDNYFNVNPEPPDGYYDTDDEPAADATPPAASAAGGF